MRIILSFLFAALLVGCSTSLKPLRFHGGIPAKTNELVLIQTSKPPLHFVDGHTTKPAPIILKGVDTRKGAELLLTKPVPVAPTNNTPPVKPQKTKSHAGWYALWYGVVGLIVLGYIRYSRITKPPVIPPAQSPPPEPPAN